MKDIFTGISLLFVIPSCIYFWKWIIEYEKQCRDFEREVIKNDKENNKLDFW